MEKKKKQPKKENKQIVEIHIYVHQQPNLYGTSGQWIANPTTICTCGKSMTSPPCRIHPLNQPYIVTC